MKWILMVWAALCVACTSYSGTNASALRSVDSYAEGDASAGEGDADVDDDQDNVEGRGGDAGAGSLALGDAANSEGDGDQVDPGVDGPKPEPDPAPVTDPWFVGVWAVKLTGYMNTSAIQCAIAQTWRVHTSEVGLHIERDDAEDLDLDRVAWGFEGTSPDGFFVVSFAEETRALSGTMKAAADAACQPERVIGERVGDHL